MFLIFIFTTLCGIPQGAALPSSSFLNANHRFNFSWTEYTDESITQEQKGLWLFINETNFCGETATSIQVRQETVLQAHSQIRIQGNNSKVVLSTNQQTISAEGPASQFLSRQSDYPKLFKLIQSFAVREFLVSMIQSADQDPELSFEDGVFKGVFPAALGNQFTGIHFSEDGRFEMSVDPSNFISHIRIFRNDHLVATLEISHVSTQVNADDLNLPSRASTKMIPLSELLEEIQQ